MHTPQGGELGTSHSRELILTFSKLVNVYTTGREARNTSIEIWDINYFKVVKCIHHREGSEEHLTRKN